MTDKRKIDQTKSAAQRQSDEEAGAAAGSKLNREDLLSADFSRLPGSAGVEGKGQEQTESQPGGSGDRRTDLTSRYEVGDSTEVDSGMFEGREGMSEYMAGQLDETTQRFRDAGALGDSSAPNIFDQATASGPSASEYQGRAGISDGSVAKGLGYGFRFDDDDGVKSTKPVDPSKFGAVGDVAEGLSRAFIPGKTDYGPTNQQMQEVNRELDDQAGNSDAGPGTQSSGGQAGGENENPKSYSVTNEDGTVTVVKGDKTYILDPKTNTVVEKDVKTGETVTTSPNTGMFGDPGAPDGPDGQGIDLPPGFIGGDALLPPGLRTREVLQGTTGVGQRGGETVNPSRLDEGGGGRASLGEPTGLHGMTGEEHFGQPAGPGVDDPQGGGALPSDPTLGPGQDVINPGDESDLPPGETLTEDPSDIQTSTPNISGIAQEQGYASAEDEGYTYGRGGIDHSVDLSVWSPAASPEVEEDYNAVDDPQEDAGI